MSFDIGVWCAEPGVSNADLMVMYTGIIEGTWSPPPHEAVQKCMAEIAALWPDIAMLEDDDEFELSPWSCEFDLHPGHCLWSIAFSRLEVVDQVVEIARRHGLVCFDPQSEAALCKP